MIRCTAVDVKQTDSQVETAPSNPVCDLLLTLALAIPAAEAAVHE